MICVVKKMKKEKNKLLKTFKKNIDIINNTIKINNINIYIIYQLQCKYVIYVYSIEYIYIYLFVLFKF
jgi:hypothetical protein